jgi:ferritin-like metal-binding protein YciE
MNTVAVGLVVAVEAPGAPRLQQRSRENAYARLKRGGAHSGPRFAALETEGRIMPAKHTGLQELLVEDLRDLYDAEKHLVRALPKVAKACENEELGNAFRDHLEQTKGQVARLEQAFKQMGLTARGKPCKAMKGLVEEAQEIMEEHDEPGMLDAALVAAGRKVEHYEMAGYESASLVAAQLGNKGVAQLLQETLREEMDADKLLARISRQVLKTASSAGEPAGGRSKSSAGNSGRRRGHVSAEPVVDHERIREWAEARGARPACVRGTGGRGDTGMIRLDFPGYSGAESLQQISWDDWFETFDENNLALLVREGDNFNKLVRRPAGTGGGRQKARSAR